MLAYCIADPGAKIVKMAQHKGIEVQPLVGTSSLMLALMASGFNGQNFAFNGYLPIDKGERVRAIKNLEMKIFKENQTQLFIEAPYRNNQMLETLATVCSPNTMICVACDISLETQFIKTKTAKQWKNNPPNLHKRNTVFVMYK